MELSFLERAREWGSTVLVAALAGNFAGGIFLFVVLIAFSLGEGAEFAAHDVGAGYMLALLFAGYGTMVTVPTLAVIGIPSAIRLRRHSTKWWFLAGGIAIGGMLGAILGPLVVSLSFGTFGAFSPGALFLSATLGIPSGVCVGLAWAGFARQKLGSLHSSAE